MLRSGFLSSMWLGLLLLLYPGPLSGNPPADKDSAINSTLALQRAVVTARHLLLAGESKKAVDILEEQLARINGNAEFLRLLSEAYRAYIKDLWLANNSTGAKRYLERLCILEPAAAQDATLRPPETTATIVPPEPKGGLLQNLPAKFFPNFALTSPKKDAPPAKPSAVRAKVENAVADNNPFAPENRRPGGVDPAPNPQVHELVSRAEQEFARRNFSEARVLFAQAYAADKNAVNNSRDRWAYCLLNQVVDQLNQPAQSRTPLAELEQQVHGALALAPSLQDTGKWLLREIDQRHKTQAAGSLPPEVTAEVTVRHLGRNKEGWQVAETTFFRIFHNQDRNQIEKVAAIAEKTRRDMYHKWFGNDGIDWAPKCELILHPTGNDYSRMTGVSSASPGHSRIESDPSGQRVLSRRMDLRCDNPGMLDAVLPHETTHVVLAGMFGNHNVPRWADEGIAVLTEPAHKVDLHRRNLERCLREGSMFGVKELMQLQDYPQPRRIGAFYAQSVCLVEFMTELRGPQVFTAFLRDGLQNGYDEALRKHFNMDMNDLQDRWQQRLVQAGRVAVGK